MLYNNTLNYCTPTLMDIALAGHTALHKAHDGHSWDKVLDTGRDTDACTGYGTVATGTMLLGILLGIRYLMVP